MCIYVCVHVYVPVPVYVQVEGLDVLSGESKRASSTIVQHTFADGRHLVTCDPDLGVEFEMGTSQATLSPPKNASSDKATCAVGFHVYPGLKQVMTVGDLQLAGKDKSAPLSDQDDYYCGYKFEVWLDDTLLAQQRVHEYKAETHTFVLKGPLALTGAPGSIEAGSSVRVFPDQLLPQLRDSVTPKDVSKGAAGA